ncbi:MAG: hypothetical protein QHH75_12560 [Bacillota bacterium]|nr:hypothetical protein [Bacillota bacterium]
MRRLTTLFLLTLFLGITISACKGESFNNGSSQRNTKQDNDIPIKDSTSLIQHNEQKKNSSDISETTEEMFYGQWVIKEHIECGRVSTYTQEDIERLVGKRIAYSVDSACFDNKLCKKPYYKKSIISDNEFFESFYASFDRLGINEKSAIIVDVYIDSDCNNLWDSTGSTFLIKDQNTLVLFDDGEFFKLVRVN